MSSLAERRIADAVYTALSADREVYTVEVVERLQNHEQVIRASQHYVELKALPIPAVLFRLAAERTRERSQSLSYGLVSPWPINKDNTANTVQEKLGLEAVIRTPGQPYYGEELRPDKQRHLIAVYPDVAVSQACIDCHSQHPDSPRHDFKLGEVMGAMVVRVATL